MGHVLARAAGLCLVLGVAAASAPAPATEGARPLSRAHVVVGTVVAVDLTAAVLTVRPDGVGQEPLRLELAEDTRLVSEGRRLRREDLRAGDRVLVTCHDPGPGRHRAQLVRRRPGRTAPSPVTP